MSAFSLELGSPANEFRDPGGGSARATSVGSRASVGGVGITDPMLEH